MKWKAGPGWSDSKGRSPNCNKDQRFRRTLMERSRSCRQWLAQLQAEKADWQRPRLREDYVCASDEEVIRWIGDRQAADWAALCRSRPCFPRHPTVRFDRGCGQEKVHPCCAGPPCCIAPALGLGSVVSTVCVRCNAVVPLSDPWRRSHPERTGSGFTHCFCPLEVVGFEAPLGRRKPQWASWAVSLRIFESLFWLQPCCNLDGVEVVQEQCTPSHIMDALHAWLSIQCSAFGGDQRPQPQSLTPVAVPLSEVPAQSILWRSVRCSGSS